MLTSISFEEDALVQNLHKLETCPSFKMEKILKYNFWSVSPVGMNPYIWPLRSLFCIDLQT